MNTEELERSLRAEFDDQLRKVLEQTRLDVERIQKDLEAEFEKQRAQIDEVFRSLSSRLEGPAEFDRGFTEVVVEHLRLARDEGARITATAIGEADKLTQTSHENGGNYSRLRDAIDRIKNQQTQASILRALVEAAEDFAPRGAFFIVKNDHLVGWKVFGSAVDEAAVRSIHFPLNSGSLLTEAVSSLSVTSGSAGSASANSAFLEQLGFSSDGRMAAIPLAARGRGVAVLFADAGAENEGLNVEALETIVSVAGLTVELRAAGTANAAENTPQQTNVESNRDETDRHQGEPEYNGTVNVEQATDPDQQNYVADTMSGNGASNGIPHKTDAEAVPVEHEVDRPSQGVAEPPRRRQSDREMDLPIAVSEDERRPHSEARRFARLLISEIKLYNEQKVIEGRESGEIYESLREAIDRSREMYDKRVRPDVAAKFDYFHYELVNNLAEGDEEKLGAGYFAVKA